VENIQIRNDFYVSEIKNLPEKVAIKKVYVRDCENRKLKRLHFTDASVNKFYIPYSKEADSFNY